MKYVSASAVDGTVTAPASKSMAQRAVIAALLSRGKTLLRHLTPCDDTLAAIAVARSLGAVAEQRGDDWTITSDFPSRALPCPLSCGESGLLARMILPVAGLLPSGTRVEGRGSLARRPFDMVVEPLQSLGVRATTAAGLLPVHLSGRLTGGEARLDGSVSSQFLTGLLMALPLAPRDSTLHVTDLKSTPYIDMTLSLLRAFGIRVEREGYHRFSVPGQQVYTPRVHDVEGDWSAASCLLVAGSIAGRARVTNLDPASLQADRAILEILRLAGARVTVAPDRVTVERPSLLRPFTFDATGCPDLFPAAVALASCCGGTSSVAGAGRLAHKESDRAGALAREYGKLGITIRVEGDVMHVTGGEIRAAEVFSHDDHRVAMSLAVAALRSTGTVAIRGASSVNKSYPRFWSDFSRLHAAR
jgi:3-phosphoshikimate 1-carboxyvinyltransferase